MAEKKSEISGSVKLHIGDFWAELKTLVQFQHSTFKINNLSWLEIFWFCWNLAICVSLFWQIFQIFQQTFHKKSVKIGLHIYA